MEMEYFENDLSIFNSTDFIEDEPISREIEKYVLPPLIILIAVLGIIGNGTLIYILRQACARNAENTYILNLAVADLTVLLFFVPFTDLYSVVTVHYPFGPVICTVSESLYDIALGVSVFTLVAMSAHSLVNGGEIASGLRGKQSKRNAVGAVAIIWGLAVAVAIPTMLFTHVLETYGYNNEDITLCLSSKPELSSSIGPFRMVVYFLVPATAIGVFLVLSRFNQPSNVRNLDGKEFSDSVFALFGVYVIVFLPSNLMTVRNLVFAFEYTQFWHSVNVLAYFLAFVYRCLNPMAIYWSSDTFRKHFNRFLFCWCARRNREPVSDVELPLQRDE